MISWSSLKGLQEHTDQVLWSSFQTCGNTSELKKGVLSKILFPIYIGVNGAVESYSCRLEADNSKTVNPTDKVDTLGERTHMRLQLWKKITVFVRDLWLGSSWKEKICDSMGFWVSAILSIGPCTLLHEHSAIHIHWKPWIFPKSLTIFQGSPFKNYISSNPIQIARTCAYILKFEWCF